jgi:hypothetical protein
MSETAMMASNRIRLRHMAQEGHRGARLAVALLGKTDQLLGVILLGNTLVNSIAAMLTGSIALQIFGQEKMDAGGRRPVRHLLPAGIFRNNTQGSRGHLPGLAGVAHRLHPDTAAARGLPPSSGWSTCLFSRC